MTDTIGGAATPEDDGVPGHWEAVWESLAGKRGSAGFEQLHRKAPAVVLMPVPWTPWFGWPPVAWMVSPYQPCGGARQPQPLDWWFRWLHQPYDGATQS